MNTGGVDKFDMLEALYRIDHKSAKWYRRIFLWALSLSAINGWLLYKRHCEQRNVLPKDRLDLMKFVSRIADSLIRQEKLAKPEVRRHGRPSAAWNMESDSDLEEPATCKPKHVFQPAPNDEIRFDNTNHMPAHQEPMRRFRVCGSHVRMICMKCNVYLCITKEKNCFLDYHIKQS